MNNQNSLDEILDKFIPAIQDGEVWVAAAKAAINKTIMKDLLASLPDEKVGTDRIPLIDAERGYNIAIQDVRQQITTKYGRADNE